MIFWQNNFFTRKGYQFKYIAKIGADSDIEIILLNIAKIIRKYLQ